MTEPIELIDINKLEQDLNSFFATKINIGTLTSSLRADEDAKRESTVSEWIDKLAQGFETEYMQIQESKSSSHHRE